MDRSENEHPGVCSLSLIHIFLGHLALANAFLKASPPRDLKTTCARTTTKGALALIVGNSYKALSSCNTFSVPNQDAIRACLE